MTSSHLSAVIFCSLRRPLRLGGVSLVLLAVLGGCGLFGTSVLELSPSTVRFDGDRATLTLTNTGEERLRWSLDVRYNDDRAWFLPERSSGEIAAGETVDIGLVLRDDLVPGRYSAVVSVTSGEVRQRARVTARIDAGEPRLELPGRVIVFDEGAATLTVRNAGGGELAWQALVRLRQR
ncbi:MAG: hypothetical protein U5L04_09230 [Trueperaceae bacterium]|nr:hypothetical protein [Trueperaceae bacterium]